MNLTSSTGSTGTGNFGESIMNASTLINTNNSFSCGVVVVGRQQTTKKVSIPTITDFFEYRLCSTGSYQTDHDIISPISKSHVMLDQLFHSDPQPPHTKHTTNQKKQPRRRSPPRFWMEKIEDTDSSMLLLVVSI